MVTRVLLLCLISALCGCGGDPPAYVSPRMPRTLGLGHHIDFRRDEDFSRFKPLNQASITIIDDGIMIRSEGEDAQLAVPETAIAPAAHFAAVVEISAPADTIAQLYYATDEHPGFTEAQVASVSLKMGRNRVLFQINDPYLIGTFRFDPGKAAGEYILHGFEIFSSEPLSTAPETPAAE